MKIRSKIELVIYNPVGPHPSGWSRDVLAKAYDCFGDRTAAVNLGTEQVVDDASQTGVTVLRVIGYEDYDNPYGWVHDVQNLIDYCSVINGTEQTVPRYSLKTSYEHKRTTTINQDGVQAMARPRESHPMSELH